MPAWAHSPLPGIEGFYIGLLHPVSTPSQLLALLGLGAMLGMTWPDGFTRPWIAFVSGLVLGIGGGQIFGVWDVLPVILLTMALIAAGLAALLPGQMRTLEAGVTGLAGLLIGLLSTPDPGPATDTAITLAGSFAGANLALLYVSGATGWLRERYDQPWMMIGLRIVAAWIAAIAMLMGALSIAS